MVRPSPRLFVNYAKAAVEGGSAINTPQLARLGLERPGPAELLTALTDSSAPGAFHLPRTASRVFVALQQPYERGSGQYSFLKQALPRLAFHNPGLEWKVAYLPPTHHHVLRHHNGREELVTHAQAKEEAKRRAEEEDVPLGDAASVSPDASKSAGETQAEEQIDVGLKRPPKPRSLLAKSPSEEDTRILAEADLKSPSIRIDFADGSNPRVIKIEDKSRTSLCTSPLSCFWLSFPAALRT